MIRSFMFQLWVEMGEISAQHSSVARVGYRTRSIFSSAFLPNKNGMSASSHPMRYAKCSSVMPLRATKLPRMRWTSGYSNTYAASPCGKSCRPSPLLIIYRITRIIASNSPPVKSLRAFSSTFSLTPFTAGPAPARSPPRSSAPSPEARRPCCPVCRGARCTCARYRADRCSDTGS